MYIQNWKLDFEEHRGISCNAPCSLYSVLRDNALIPEPYYGTNEIDLSRLSEKDCRFYTTFAVTKEDLAHDHVELLFHGLDTICDIYLNEKHLDSVINMHRCYRYDAKDWLFVGENSLRFEFHSPVRYFGEMNAKHFIYTNADTIPGAAHLRKALFMSGWDWAPTLPDMGIFRPVELRTYNTDRLSDVEILQYHENGRVRLVLSAETEWEADGNRITATVDGKTLELVDGCAEVIIENPRLWWPNGFGEQNLYDITFTLTNGGVSLGNVCKTVGLRTLTVSMAKVKDGNEFCFVVNGIKIFAKGANYVPMDSILSTITPDRIARLIEDCKFAHFNCIRVWGGAYYPEDEFYDLCDRAGLIVWQDFMLACMNAWLREEFEYEVTLEAIEQVKRIRHHASLGLLCGNNEMELFVDGKIGASMLVKVEYLKLYEHILPEICNAHAPQIFYLPSSPTSGGGFDEPNADNRGDVHFWKVWNGSASFTEYRKHKFRFCSEYGFESMPSIKTIDSFCPPEERNLLSYTMEDHQKHKNGNRKFLMYLADEYQLPITMENLVYATQLNQAHAIKYGVEHFRRIRGYCMGSVYWQLNDCWPVSSWSSVDYYGRYKALHYFARKFYAPVAMGLFAEDGEITVNLANETLSDFTGTLKVGVRRADFTEVYSDELAVSVKSLKSRDVAVYESDWFKGSRETYFFADLYDADGSFIMRQTELSTKPKFFQWQKPEIRVEAEQEKDGVWFSFTSDVFVKNLQIDFKHYDLALTDNYFDLATDAPYRVFAKTDVAAKALLEEIQLRSVYDMPYPEKG